MEIETERLTAIVEFRGEDGRKEQMNGKEKNKDAIEREPSGHGHVERSEE